VCCAPVKRSLGDYARLEERAKHPIAGVKDDCPIDASSARHAQDVAAMSRPRGQ
jgi:hypothetical protein